MKNHINDVFFYLLAFPKPLYVMFLSLIYDKIDYNVYLKELFSQ